MKASPEKLEYIRNWAAAHPEAVLAAKRKWQLAHRDEHNQSTKRWQKANKEAKKAQEAVGHAIRGRRLTRKPCQVCANPKSHAHHPDYNKPLEVIWLCARHHKQEHKKCV
jgi:hypothetical protein